MKQSLTITTLILVITTAPLWAMAANDRKDSAQAGCFTNSIGMEFVDIQPGTFRMGFGDKPLDRRILR